jgi:hypothetical protein
LPKSQERYRDFISISILRGKRKAGGIIKERGESAARNRPGKGLYGKNAEFC